MIDDLAKRTPLMSAMSYGPFTLLKALVLGLILGSLAFIALALLAGGADQAQQLRDWFYIVGAGLALSLTVSAVANYVIGRRVQQHIEHSRKHSLGSPTRPPERGAKTSGFILRPENAQGSPAPNTSKRKSSQLEGQH